MTTNRDDLLARMTKAAKELSFQAQTTSRIAGPDNDLMRAIAEIAPLFTEYAALPQHPEPSEAVAIDVEAMLRECVPGGDSCDPQRVCDDIREYFERHRAAQSEARGAAEVVAWQAKPPHYVHWAMIDKRHVAEYERDGWEIRELVVKSPPAPRLPEQSISAVAEAAKAFVRMTPGQLMEALDTFTNTDSEDDWPEEIAIVETEDGLIAYDMEYPEEGGVTLDSDYRRAPQPTAHDDSQRDRLAATVSDAIIDEAVRVWFDTATAQTAIGAKEWDMRKRMRAAYESITAALASSPAAPAPVIPESEKEHG
jgi:hypothetical protein